MNSKIRSWWPWRRRDERPAKEPGAPLFQGLRVRLTLWYCAVLGVALVLFCVILYALASYLFLNPIRHNVADRAHFLLHEWQSGGACSPLNADGRQGRPPLGGPPDNSQGYGPQAQPELLACYNQQGTFMQFSGTSQLPAAFLNDSLAKKALAEGEASDTVDAGGSLGPVTRYALAVPDPHGDGYVGVIVTGASINNQTNQLSTLLALLIGVGSLTLVGAGVGGLFLANQALAPAHLAFTRQQRFIADASHELRTPLTLMRADAEVLLRGRAQLTEEDAALLEDIVAEVKHMSLLANSMLTLARVDAGLQHREHEVVSMDELAERSAQRIKALAEQKGIAVQSEQSGDAVIIGDHTLLEQAILVLLDNAIKYNRPGGRVLLRTSTDKGKARVDVIDTGIGITPEHLPHLSERFYRVDKARSREAGGAGLGLSIAHGIASAHGGTLTLSSIPEQGTTASLLLPLASVSASHHQASEQNMQQVQTAKHTQTN